VASQAVAIDKGGWYVSSKQLVGGRVGWSASCSSQAAARRARAASPAGSMPCSPPLPTHLSACP
jgi:hypothetical protein